MADLVWKRFGDVDNYVEPFAGSLAVLLARPTRPRVETVNDIDAFLANFWRAVKLDPVKVAGYADYPVSELDMHSRHRWLMAQKGLRERLYRDPDYYDAKVAGWWVWGKCAWIADGWCAGPLPNKLPNMNSTDTNRSNIPQSLPHLGNPGRGTNRSNIPQSLPHLGDPGRGTNRSNYILGQFHALANRLRDVRVACGDWARVVTDAVTTRHGLTGVFLDPPYSLGEHSIRYAGVEHDVAADVAKWCAEHGNDPLFRIALCGYEGSVEMPGDWECVRWKAAGGYGHGEKGRKNAHRETVWFSPHCRNRTLLGVVR